MCMFHISRVPSSTTHKDKIQWLLSIKCSLHFPGDPSSSFLGGWWWLVKGFLCSLALPSRRFTMGMIMSYSQAISGPGIHCSFHEQASSSWLLSVRRRGVDALLCMVPKTPGTTVLQWQLVTEVSWHTSQHHLPLCVNNPWWHKTWIYHSDT